MVGRHLGTMAVIALGTVIATQAVSAQEPKYGGTLTIVPYSPGIAALSWDPADWNWKVSIDAGPYMEQLMVGDLSKGVRGGGKNNFFSEAWLSDDVLRGELAESWEVVDKPLSIVINLRKNVKWQACKGIMEARDFTAKDVVFAYNRLVASPKANKVYFSFIDRAEETGPHQVTFFLKEYNSEWKYRLGYGYYAGIYPKEITEAPNGGAGNWQNACGTGPFRLTRYEAGAFGDYQANKEYWDRETIDGKPYKIPFVDNLVMRTIGDSQTRLAAFRTGKIDVMTNISWDELKSLAPIRDKIKVIEHPDYAGEALAMRVDAPPFDNPKVRLALNLAVDRAAISKQIYGGHADFPHLPMDETWEGYFTPPEKMPNEAREVLQYDPAKAKKLLAEAGLANGFEFKAQVPSFPEQLKKAQIVAGYLSAIGVKMTIEPKEYGAFLSLMTTGKHGPGYWHFAGMSNPTASIEKLYRSSSVWNSARVNDPKVDAALDTIQQERDPDKVKKGVAALTNEMTARAPFLFLPRPRSFTVWWPWVKNYYGEISVSARRDAPVWARAWIDQDLKKSMGF